MQKIREFLMGKKTYLTSLAAAIAAVVGFAEGALNEKEAITAIVAAILACTLHARMDR